jgi:hypothetical protein
MPLTMHEFERGVAYWRQSTRWPADFHNAFYARLAEQNPHGEFTEAWWQQFSRDLRAWRATRPLPRAVLTHHAVRTMPALQDAWSRRIAPLGGRDIAEVTWGQIEEFPALVRAIKPGRRPVFTAKFCHFLLPAVFPVVDGAVMGLPFGDTYQAHFDGVQREWISTPAAMQDELKAVLTTLIDAPLTPGYPLVNKIVELCLIGRRNGGAAIGTPDRQSV